ncbi:hypothetical protein BDY19DRAFT_612158 [Irpex rosettiformis]|uniref:Uncharacterized protein n=1 Tax=Irpex rosettiformis TaxID=378272 RepID=A0ACB8TP70_9APHY|nr:hypothetical protein BDY19DRAFT_612158 [Irpex rosettiformis]
MVPLTIPKPNALSACLHVWCTHPTPVSPTTSLFVCVCIPQSLTFSIVYSVLNPSPHCSSFLLYHSLDPHPRVAPPLPYTFTLSFVRVSLDPVSRFFMLSIYRLFYFLLPCRLSVCPSFLDDSSSRTVEAAVVYLVQWMCAALSYGMKFML